MPVSPQFSLQPCLSPADQDVHVETHKYHLWLEAMQPQLLSFAEPKNQFAAACCSSDMDQRAEVVVILQHSVAVGWGTHRQRWEHAAFTTTAKMTPQSLKITPLHQHLLLTVSTVYKAILLILDLS